MKDTAPISKGVLVIAALFGIVALIVSMVAFKFGFFGAFFIGLIVAAIVIVALMLGGRNEQSGAESAKPAATPAPEAVKPAVAPAAASPAPAAAPEPAPAPKAETKPAEAPKPQPAAKTEAPAAKAPAADGKPELLQQARDSGADNLKLIKGVGPKMEKTLNGMGIFHFDQVAGWTEKEQEWVDDNLEGFKGRVTRDEWVKQAKILAAGGTTEFSEKSK